MRKLFYVLIAVVLVPAGAEAADWTAVKLRGQVFAASPAGDGHWVRLRRGDVIDDARPIRTLGNGHVEFQSGDETITFGPATQAEILDRAGRRFTTVTEQAGTVTVAAEAREVVHFSVETPYLVAVVKGTLFSVGTGAGGSGVTVARGLVAVTDRQTRRQVLLPAGRNIVVAADGRSIVSGQANPALVHPRVNGVIEDAEAAAGTSASAGSVVAGSGIGAFLRGDLGATVGGVGQTTGTLGGTVGTAVGGVGATVGGLGQATGAVGTTLGNALGGLGSGTRLGTVTSGIGSALGTTTTTLGATVSGVGAAVNGVGATVNAATMPGTGTLGRVTQSVSGTVGGALAHLGL